MTALPLVVANWKMHGVAASLRQARRVADSLRAAPEMAQAAICVPATLVDRLRHALTGSDVLVGGQNIHAEAAGAFTGDISAEMLADAGARIVIIGHSERRAAYGESDGDVRRKATAAARAGLRSVICVGETLAERGSGRALEIIADQISGSVPAALTGDDFVVAYEPVWAIGTKQTPEAEEIERMHRALREQLRHARGTAADQVRILYGGSVTSGNAAEILRLDAVDGVLVGAASLDAEQFLSIVRAAASPA